MRTVKMTELIGASFDRSVDILFRPFSLKKWLRLLVIAFLAGALLGGNGSGGGGGGESREKKEKQTSAQSSAAKDAEKGAMSSGSAPEAVRPSRPRPSPAAVAIFAGAAFLLIAVFIILAAWVGSRFKFVWFNAIANNTTSIAEPYSRHAREANSLFKFSLVVTLAFLLSLALLIGGTVWAMYAHGVFRPNFVWSAATALRIFLLPALLLVAVILVLLVLAVVIDHFLVMIMALDAVRIGQAFKKLGEIFRANGRDILLFILVFALLALLAGGCATALAFVMILAFLVLGALIFGVPFLILWPLLKAKLVFIAYAIGLGIPFVATAIITLMAASLPFAVFFRLFSIGYLVSLNCGYTRESFERYAARRAERVWRAAPAFVVICLFAVGLIFIVGLLAAIAVPNFARARQAALEKRAAAQTAVSKPPAGLLR